VLVERRGGEQEQGLGQESVHGKSVGFAAVGVEGAEVGNGLREVEPRAEDEEQEEDEVEEEEEIIEREVDWRDTLDESAEWARASEERSEDSQSEEYEEDEREEGDELEYDQ
jgi:peroxin-2